MRFCDNSLFTPQSKGAVRSSVPPTEAALIGLSQDGVRLQNGQVLKCKHARLLGSVRVPRLQAMAAGGGGGRARDKRKAKMQGQAALTKRARCGDWTMKKCEQAPREEATAGASAAAAAAAAAAAGGGGDGGDVVVLSWVEVVLEEGKNREVNVSVVIVLLEADTCGQKTCSYRKRGDHAATTPYLPPI
jgi:hypothetical protein